MCFTYVKCVRNYCNAFVQLRSSKNALFTQPRQLLSWWRWSWCESRLIIIIIIIPQLQGRQTSSYVTCLVSNCSLGERPWVREWKIIKSILYLQTTRGPLCVCAFLFGVALLFKALKLDIILKCTLETWWHVFRGC